MANGSHANGLEDDLGHAAAAAAAAAAKCSPGCDLVSGDGGSGHPPSGVRDHQHDLGHEQQQQQQQQQMAFYGDRHRRQPGYTGGQGWERRVLVGTAVGATAGAIGGIARNAVMPMAGGVAVAANAAAVVASSRRSSRPLHSVASIALNATVVAASLAGCTEVVRELRSGWADETVNGLLGGGIAGYALGTLHGGRPLGPPTAVVGMAAGVALHAVVRQVEVWRLHLMHGELHGSTSSSASAHPTDHLQRNDSFGGSASVSWIEHLLDRAFGTAAPSSSSSAQLDHHAEPTSRESQVGVRQAPAEAEVEEKEWPKWLPIRKLTKKELQEREEKLARIKQAKAALDAENHKP